MQTITFLVTECRKNQTDEEHKAEATLVVTETEKQKIMESMHLEYGDCRQGNQRNIYE